MVKTETKPLDSEELVLNRLQELVNFRKNDQDIKEKNDLNVSYYNKRKWVEDRN